MEEVAELKTELEMMKSDGTDDDYMQQEIEEMNK